MSLENQQHKVTRYNIYLDPKVYIILSAILVFVEIYIAYKANYLTLRYNQTTLLGYICEKLFGWIFDLKSKYTVNMVDGFIFMLKNTAFIFMLISPIAIHVFRCYAISIATLLIFTGVDLLLFTNLMYVEAGNYMVMSEQPALLLAVTANLLSLFTLIIILISRFFMIKSITIE